MEIKNKNNGNTVAICISSFISVQGQLLRVIPAAHVDDCSRYCYYHAACVRVRDRWLPSDPTPRPSPRGHLQVVLADQEATEAAAQTPDLECPRHSSEEFQGEGQAALRRGAVIRGHAVVVSCKGCSAALGCPREQATGDPHTAVTQPERIAAVRVVQPPLSQRRLLLGRASVPAALGPSPAGRAVARWILGAAGSGDAVGGRRSSSCTTTSFDRLSGAPRSGDTGGQA